LLYYWGLSLTRRGLSFALSREPLNDWHRPISNLSKRGSACDKRAFWISWCLNTSTKILHWFPFLSDSLRLRTVAQEAFLSGLPSAWQFSCGQCLLHVVVIALRSTRRKLIWWPVGRTPPDFDIAADEAEYSDGDSALKGYSSRGAGHVRKRD